MTWLPPSSPSSSHAHSHLAHSPPTTALFLTWAKFSPNSEACLCLLVSGLLSPQIVNGSLILQDFTQGPLLKRNPPGPPHLLKPYCLFSLMTLCHQMCGFSFPTTNFPAFQIPTGGPVCVCVCVHACACVCVCMFSCYVMSDSLLP